MAAHVSTIKTHVVEDTLALQTNNSTRLNITSAGVMTLSGGSVGSGTESPGSVWWTSTKSLHISDATAAGLFLTNTTNALEFNLGCDSGGGVYFDVHDSTDGNDNFFAFRTEETGGANTPTERMRINTNGYVK